MLAGQRAAVSQVTLLGSARMSEVPAVIVAGLDAYKAKGPGEAIKVWVRNGPLDGDTATLSQADGLQQVQNVYGAYQSFDVMSSRDLSPRVRIVYMVMNYEKGPLFARFVCYRSDREWTVTNFVLNTLDTEVLPADVSLSNQ
jgi:hypothetical protein